MVSPATKRQPTLADRFVASGGRAGHRYLERSYTDALARKVRDAHKFVLDENAATHVAHVVRDIPQLIIRQHDFARAPYDLTWIEFPHWKYWQEMGNDPYAQDDTADHTLGYLIETDTVTTISGGTIARNMIVPHPGVFIYSLNAAWAEEEREEFLRAGNTDHAHFDAYMWGSTIAHMDVAMRNELRCRYAVGLAPILKTKLASNYRRFLNDALRGSVGELRNIVALLLMLNRPSITRYGNAPAGRGFNRGKLTNYLAHTTVTIDLDPVPTMRLLGTPAGEAVPRRWHEVRGHYCHDRPARDYRRIAGCGHDWQPTDASWSPIVVPPGERPDHWVCNDCGGKRWWRNYKDGRGHRGIGVVEHIDYRVTAP